MKSVATAKRQSIIYALLQFHNSKILPIVQEKLIANFCKSQIKTRNLIANQKTAIIHVIKYGYT